MMRFYLTFLIFLLSFWGASAQVFWSEDFNDAGATTRWSTENAPGSKTNPTPPGIVGLSYITNNQCNNYWIINDFNTPENNPPGVLPNGSTASYSTRFVRGRNYNCLSPNDLPNPDNGGGTNQSLHITFQGCSDSYSFGLNNGPEDYADEYSILNANGPSSPGASNSDQMTYMTQDISTVGKCNIYLEGQFFLGGDHAGAHSYGTVLYSINSGTTWKILADNITPSVFFLAGTCNNWETRSWLLPTECEGITTLRLAFRWRNDGNQPPINTTADYTLLAGFNVDNIVLKEIGPTVDFNFGQMGSTILLSWNGCKMQDVTTLNNITTGSGITGYQWSIPDAVYINGTSSTDMNPDFRFPEAATFGTKTVTLTVFYGAGCSASFSRDITLSPCPPFLEYSANFTTICSTSPSPVAGSETVVTFNNTTSSFAGRGPVSYNWSFAGPGTVTYVNATTSTSQNPQVTFDTPGLYTVTLTASNLDGAGSNSPLVKTNYINVVNCECGSALAGNVDIVSFDWNANNNFLGWNVTQNQASGFFCNFFGSNNIWRVSDAESARPPGTCGAGGAGDRSLFFGLANGAAFCDEGQNETDIVQSPLISTVGYSNLTLQFDFIGNGGTSHCDFQYSTNGGASWITPASPNFATATPAVPAGSNMNNLKTNNTGCSGQGKWTRVTWNMPAACENIPNLRIRFRFVITGGGGVDPSFAVDKLKIYAPLPPSPPAVWIGNTADWHTASNWSTGTVPGTGTSISIPDPSTLGVGKFMPVISSADAVALNVCNSGTITIGNGATNRNLTIGGFLNNFGAITTTNTNTAADITFAGTGCVYRGNGLNHDVDYRIGSAANHVLTLESDLSCRSLNLASGTLNCSNTTITLKKDLIRAAGTTLTTTATSTFVFDGPMTLTWVNPYSNPVNQTITTQDVTTNQNITLGVNTTFPNIVVRKQADANILTLASAFTYTVSNQLTIENGTLDAGLRTLNGAGNTAMTGGQLRISKLSTVLPELTGTYTLSGGTIELYGAGAQTARLLPTGASTEYFNLSFIGSGVKSLQAGTTTVRNLVNIGGTATLDVQDNTLNGTADLNMEASACSLRISKSTGSPTLPELTGNYTLATPSVIEIYTSTPGVLTQYLRQATYSRLFFSNPTASANVTRYLTGNTTVNSEVRITNANGILNTVDALEYTFDGSANLIMNDIAPSAPTLLRLAKNNVVLPEFTGTYTYNDGANIPTSPTLELYGNVAQTLRLHNAYRNLIFSNVGKKTLQNGTTTATRSVNITDGLVIVPTGTDRFNGNAELRMTGGEFQIATLQTTAPLIPEFTNTYSLLGGKINFNGSGNQTVRSVASTPTVTYHDLEFSGSGIKTLTGLTMVNSRLWLDLPTAIGNYVNALNFILYVANPVLASVLRTGGHVVGILEREINNAVFPQNYFYPVGSDNSNNTYYEPIFLKMNSALAGVTSVGCRFNNVAPSTNWTPPLNEGGNVYNNLEQEGYWEMIPDVLPAGAIDYRVEVIPSSLWVYTGTQKALVKRSPALAAPLDEWNWHGSTRISDFDRTGYQEFSEFAIVTGNTPLPVVASPLTAWGISQQKAIFVQWNSIVEENLKNYVLERSLTPNFANPEVVAIFEPKGNQQNYLFEDKNVEWNTKYFYRYQAVDVDGNSRYSNIAEATVQNSDKFFDVKVYPNPAKDHLKLSIMSAESENLTFQLFDVTGKLLFTFEDKIFENQLFEKTIDLRNLAAGVYTYRIQINGYNEQSKLVVIK